MILVAVVPTYNEVGTLARVAGEVLQLDRPDLHVRLLVVDDASTDGTAHIADELARGAPGRIEVLHRRNKRGLGSAYIEGFAQALASGADLIAQMDADLSHEPSVLAVMTDVIRNADLVIASRYVSGGGVDALWPWHRKLLSWLANRALVPALLTLPLSDATSGYRLWRHDALARIAPSVNVRSSGYGFQVEMAYLAHRLGCRIKEVPIYFRERESGQSKMSPSVALIAVREIWAIRRQHRLVHAQGCTGGDGIST
jgi:dolichol-phosphate mannosyltransferase